MMDKKDANPSLILPLLSKAEAIGNTKEQTSFVIARSETTKQSLLKKYEIASLSLAMTA